ncbi:hypothetical protein [Croceibacter atlanticus]|mgnify:CR=1 FL=1|uniref:hypothetical protein n=1 Tax=Croceibacter atlanticus TaxID=313588 RepID=UPI00249080EB|nr:hypothetical protein [Croceibacter atlanticus]
MKKIIIELSEEQHYKLFNEMKRCQQINSIEKTSSGIEFNLYGTEDGILANLDFKMIDKIELGDVSWEIV